MVLMTHEGMQSFLDDLGIGSDLVSDGATTQVVAGLGSDIKEREIVMTIQITEADLSAAYTEESARNTYQLALFLVPLPFDVRPGCECDVARLLHRVNTTLELPGFEMSETNNLIYFRYAMPLINNQLEDCVFSSLIGTIEDAIHAFSSHIESVASR